MHNFTPTDVGVFLVKMCKMKGFFFFFFGILQDFASTDVDALSLYFIHNFKLQKLAI